MGFVVRIGREDKRARQWMRKGPSESGLDVSLTVDDILKIPLW
jgi:hypothetical protein